MDAPRFDPIRAGRRWLTAALSAALAAGAANAVAQVVGVPAALISHAEGGVAVAPKGDPEWIDVKPRRALQRGDRVWTDRGARAEVQAGAHLVRMDGQSQISVEGVTEGSAQVSLLRGSVAVAVGKLTGTDNVEVGTPNLAFRARQSGDYRIDVDPKQGTTRVSVMSGAAVVYGEHGEAVDLGAGQRLTFRDRTLAKAVTPAFTAVDDFDHWIVARGRAPALAAAPAAPSVHPDAVARKYREAEAQRQAQLKRDLEELQKLKAAQAARPHATRPQATAPVEPVAPVVPPPMLPVAPKPQVQAQAKPGPRPIEQAPRIVQVPRPQVADARAVAAAARRAEDERRAAEARRAEQAQLARRADDERRAAQARRAQDERRIASALAAKKAAEDKRIAAIVARREAEQKKVVARRAEQERRIALARKAELDRKMAQVRRAQQLAQDQAVGEARAQQLVRLQQQALHQELSAREQRDARAQREEQARREAQARAAEEARREDVARQGEEARREAWERRQRAMAEQQKRDHEVWLRTQQPMQPARPIPQGVPARRVS